MCELKVTSRLGMLFGVCISLDMVLLLLYVFRDAVPLLMNYSAFVSCYSSEKHDL